VPGLTTNDLPASVWLRQAGVKQSHKHTANNNSIASRSLRVAALLHNDQEILSRARFAECSDLIVPGNSRLLRRACRQTETIVSKAVFRESGGIFKRFATISRISFIQRMISDTDLTTLDYK